LKFLVTNGYITYIYIYLYTVIVLPINAPFLKIKYDLVHIIFKFESLI